jgi:hypothetical protein
MLFRADLVFGNPESTEAQVLALVEEGTAAGVPSSHL